jgi:hypothetical protein
VVTDDSGVVDAADGVSARCGCCTTARNAVCSCATLIGDVRTRCVERGRPRRAADSSATASVGLPVSIPRSALSSETARFRFAVAFAPGRSCALGTATPSHKKQIETTANAWAGRTSRESPRKGTRRAKACRSFFAIGELRPQQVLPHLRYRQQARAAPPLITGKFGLL